MFTHGERGPGMRSPDLHYRRAFLLVPWEAPDYGLWLSSVGSAEIEVTTSGALVGALHFRFPAPFWLTLVP